MKYNIKYYLGVIAETIFIMVIMYLVFSVLLWEFNILLWYKYFFGWLMYFAMIGTLWFILFNFILGKDKD